MRTIRTMILLATLATPAALTACGGAGGALNHSVQKGVDLYARGDYPDALAVLAQLDSSTKISGKAQLRYLAYRGLAAAHVGKLDEAKAFLAQARSIYQASDPRWLPPEIVVEMNGILDNPAK